MAFKILRKNCCGLDIHKTWIFACIGITDSNGRTEYKQARFSSFSNGLRDLADWLAKYSCSDVCPARIDLGEQIYMWRQQLDGLRLADPVKKLSVKGMDFVMGGRRRFYGGIALARVAEKLPRFVLENGLNPWSAPGRAMPPFAPQTFNAWWKKTKKR